MNLTNEAFYLDSQIIPDRDLIMSVKGEKLGNGEMDFLITVCYMRMKIFLVFKQRTTLNTRLQTKFIKD